MEDEDEDLDEDEEKEALEEVVAPDEEENAAEVAEEEGAQIVLPTTLEHGEHLRTAQPSVWLQEAVDMLVAQQHGSASDVDVRINLLFTQMFVYYQNSARLFEILSYLVTFLF